MEYRALRDDEGALLRALLDHDFDGADALRSQLDLARVGSSCSCGCGSIGFTLPLSGVEKSSATSPLPVEAEIIGADGEPVGGVIVFVRDGFLHDVDVFSFGTGPLPIP